MSRSPKTASSATRAGGSFISGLKNHTNPGSGKDPELEAGGFQSSVRRDDIRLVLHHAPAATALPLVL